METTNFFEQINSLGISGEWTLVIKTGIADKIIVSVLLRPLDKTGHKPFQPMIFNDTAETLGLMFFESLEDPARKTATGFINKEQYDKAIEGVRPGASEKRGTLLAKDKKKIFDDKMKEIETLCANLKYSEALELLPAVNDYPDKEAAINTKREFINRNLAQYQAFQTP